MSETRRLPGARIEVDRVESGCLIRAIARNPHNTLYQEYADGYVAGFLSGAERGMMRPKTEF